MTKAEQRRIALGAARSQLRRIGIAITATLPFDDVLAVLDDLHRSEPDLVASRWYAQASDNQIRLLRQEWRKQFSQQTSYIRTSQVRRPVTLWDPLEAVN